MKIYCIKRLYWKLQILEHENTWTCWSINSDSNSGMHYYTERLDGDDKNSYCNPHNTDSNLDLYCALYKTGYELEWTAAQGLYGR